MNKSLDQFLFDFSIIIWSLAKLLIAAKNIFTKTYYEHQNIAVANSIIQDFKKHYHDKSTTVILAQLRKLDPYLFEYVILLSFKNKGYKISPINKRSHDKGIDGTIWNWFGMKYVIQSKRHSGYIKPQHVIDFIIDIKNHRARKGFFVHTGKINKKFIARLPNNIQIIADKKLVDLIIN